VTANNIMHAYADSFDRMADRLAAIPGPRPNSCNRRVAILREAAAGLRAAARNYDQATLCDVGIEGCGSDEVDPLAGVGGGG
jgi:hypothetical protein